MSYCCSCLMLFCLFVYLESEMMFPTDAGEYTFFFFFFFFWGGCCGLLLGFLGGLGGGGGFEGVWGLVLLFRCYY